MTTPGSSQRAIVLIGMHRTGTSVLANAVKCLGVDFGQNLFEANSANMKGYFEDIDLVSFDDKVLTSLGCGWETVLLPDLTERQVNCFAQEASSLIKSKFDNANLWGFKDPRGVRLLPVWDRAFALSGVEPSYILSCRHPFKVVSSLAQRDGLAPDHSLLLWLAHNCEGLLKLASSGGFICDYDLMLKQPEVELNRIEGFLGLKGDCSLKRKFTKSFIDKQLDRSALKSPHPLFDDKIVSICLEIYNYMVSLSARAGNVSINNEKTLEVAQGGLDYLSRLNESLYLFDKMRPKGVALREAENRLGARIAQLEASVDHIASRCVGGQTQGLYWYLADSLPPSARDGLVLCGAGSMGLALLPMLREKGFMVACIADKNPALWGTTVQGVPIRSFEDAAACGVDAYLIASLSYADQMRAEILARYADAAEPPRIFSTTMGDGRG